MAGLCLPKWDTDFRQDRESPGFRWKVCFGLSSNPLFRAAASSFQAGRVRPQEVSCSQCTPKARARVTMPGHLQQVHLGFPGTGTCSPCPLDAVAMSPLGTCATCIFSLKMHRHPIPLQMRTKPRAGRQLPKGPADLSGPGLDPGWMIYVGIYLHCLCMHPYVCIAMCTCRYTHIWEYMCIYVYM